MVITNRDKKAIRHQAAIKSWDTRGRKKKDSGEPDGAKREERPGPQSTRGDWKAEQAKGKQSVHQSAKNIAKEVTQDTDEEPYSPDVEADADGDGITDAARVGVPAKAIPPPPKVPRLPNLDPVERQAESTFAEAFESDPDGVARRLLETIYASDKVNVFETDGAKNLYDPWRGEGMSEEDRAGVRSTLNTALHQTANAVAKRAFLMHLDAMTDEQKQKGILVTVGGCGAGKGFALKTLSKQGMPELSTANYGAVWDSAGDQNATENPWVLEEAKKRGIKVTFAYISADPENSWANPKFGVVARARGTNDGRMVDATVFADSYVIGARNHKAFAEKHKNDANFIYLQNGAHIQRLDSIPETDLSRDRQKLLDFALTKVSELGESLEARIRRGATVGQRIWQ
jgi:hypothetical protein